MSRVNIRCGGTTLGLTITNHAGHNQVGLVHDRTKRHRQSITQLSTLMDGTRRFRIDVASDNVSTDWRSFRTFSPPKAQVLWASMRLRQICTDLGIPPGVLKRVMRL